MRFGFTALPDGPSELAKPIVNVIVDGLDPLPQACLLDTRATAVRFGAHVAELCGIDLEAAPERRLGVGGSIVLARAAEVSLELRRDGETHLWETYRVVLRAVDARLRSARPDGVLRPVRSDARRLPRDVRARAGAPVLIGG